MICKSCKREIVDNSIFCNWCGERQIKERTAEIKVPKPRQLPSGKWFIQLRMDGQSVPVTEDTEAECITRARAIKAGMIEKKKAAPNITVEQAIDEFIRAHENILSPSTLRGYRIIQRNRFRDYIHKEMGSNINWQRACSKEAANYSAKTVRNSWGLIAEVYRWKKMPVPEVNLPQVVHTPREWLDDEQVLEFLKAVAGKPCEIPALLCLCSLRRSEVFALDAQKIDLEHNRITVRGAVVPDQHNKFVMKDTNKNRSSARTVPIMIPQLKDALALALANGEPLFKSNPDATRNQINRVCRKAGLPEVGMHGLRHSFASLAYHLGMPEEECMRIGGWADRNTMRKIYTHLSDRDRRKSENLMTEFYLNANKNANEI